MLYRMKISIGVILIDGTVRESRSVYVDGAYLLNRIYDGAQDALIELAQIPGSGFAQVERTDGSIE